jgi:hypothetical protein
VSNPNLSLIVWTNCQARSDYPIAIRLRVKSQFVPDRLDKFPSQVWLPNCNSTKSQIPICPWSFGWIPKPGLITQLRFDEVSNPNLSLIVWMNSQARSDYPIAIRPSVKSQFVPDRLDEFPSQVWLPNCDSTKCQIPNCPWSFGWIPKPGLITQLRFDQVSNPNLSLIVWMDSQARSDYPIEIRLSVKSQFVPDRLDKFPSQVWLPNCDSTKSQIPICPWSFGWISKPGLITQLRFD